MIIKITIPIALAFVPIPIVAQKVLNTTGTIIRSEQLQLSTSLGEVATETYYGANGFITQGVLQPQSIPSAPLVTFPLSKGFCPTDSAVVSFSSFYRFEAGNEFILQLSDAKGTFGSPRVIGKITSSEIKKIPFHLPNNLSTDSTYLIRVVSTKPKLEGSVTNLFVRPKPTANFSIPEVICTGDPILAKFTGKDTIATSNFYWDFSGALWEKISAKATQGASWTIAGEKTVRLVVDNNGCLSDTIRKTITVEQRLAKPKLTCGKLSGNAITFNWSQVGGAVSYQVTRKESHPDVVQNTFNWTYRNLPSNTRIFFEVQANGIGPCAVSKDTITCATLICPSFSASLKKPEVSICEGNSAYAELDLKGANVPGAYALVYSSLGSKPDTIKVQPGQNPAFSPIANTTYNLISLGNESYEGCFTSLTRPLIFTVSVISNNQPGIPKAPFLACDNQDSPIVLNDHLDKEDGNGEWRSSFNIPLSSFDPVAGTFIPRQLPEGKYSFIYTVPGKNGCQARSSTVVINLERKLEVKIDEFSNCLDPNGKTIIDLSNVARRVNAFASNSVTWYRDQNLKDTIKVKTFEISAPTLVFALVGKGKCASPVVGITLKPGENLPVPKIEGEFQYRVGESINLRTTSSFPPGSVFTWRAPDTLVSGTDIYQFPVRLITKFSEGRYTLHVRGPQEVGKPSCESPTAWSEIEVFDVGEPALSIGAYASDSNPWKIKGLEAFPKHRISIFNRWGEQVFYIEGAYGNDWTGTFNGKKLPQGAYYYQIETGEVGQKAILGSVSVIR